MRKVIVIAIVMGFLAVFGMAAPEKGGEEAQIRARSQEFVAAWNRHDPKAMAALWIRDGDLINPFGQVANGREAVEKLLTNEHSTFMKGTTFTIANMKARMIKPDVAMVDWDVEISGMHGSDGSPMAPLKVHINQVMVKQGGQWWTAAARPVSYLPTPGSAPAK